ncbi:MAG: hypothetical protein ACOX3G_00100 [Armatimonadota bacterium]
MARKIIAVVEDYLKANPVSHIPILLNGVFQMNDIWHVELSTTASTYGNFDENAFTIALMDYVLGETGVECIVYGLQRDGNKSKRRKGQDVS